MPRTTGTYAAPSNSVNPAVTGTNIDPSDFNALVDDLEAALTESVYTSGLGATDNRLVRTDGTDTKRLQSTGITVDDSNNVSGVASITLAGGGTLREVLSAVRTYYVRTDGSDSNNGLANTAGGAFLTIQKAIDVAASLDSSIYDVTIQVAAGTYATATGNVLKNMAGAGAVNIVGDTATPSNVVIEVTGAMTNRDGIFRATGLSTTYKLRGFRLRENGASSIVFGIFASAGSNVEFESIEFGSITSGLISASQHVRAEDQAVIRCTGNYSISGSASNHAGSVTATIRIQAYTLTITGTPAFKEFAVASTLGAILINAMTFSGSATGSHYLATGNSAIFTSGAGATYLPGSTAGSVATGGQYI